MEILAIISISLITIIFFLSILLTNKKTSNKIAIEGNILSIFHPLKKKIINLDKDIKSWNIQRVNLLWWGRVYSINLELKTGKWKKVYSRDLTNNTGQLASYLEKNIAARKRN